MCNIIYIKYERNKLYRLHFTSLIFKACPIQIACLHGGFLSLLHILFQRLI